MEWVCDRLYVPALRFCLRYPMTPIAIAAMLLLGTFGMIRGGVVPSVLFPKTDNNFLQASVTFPDGTPVAEADAATRRMEEGLRRISDRIANARAKKESRDIEDIYKASENDLNGPVRLTYRDMGTITNTQNAAGGGASGSHVGQIFAELCDTSIRNIKSDEILAMWRKEVGEIPGADRVNYGTIGVGPGGKAIEFKLLASGENEGQLMGATEEMKKRLAEFAGVYDISDDNIPGKWEFQFQVRKQALATGITEMQLGNTVRNTYYGAEAMRLQRGRHEVKLMVRYPEEERQNLVNFREIRVQDNQGMEKPIGELAKVELSRGFSEINRVDQMRSITVSADIDETTANAEIIINTLQKEFVPGLMEKYPDISLRWEGQREQSRESFSSLLVGFFAAICAMYVLLVLQFRSYIQPLLILLIVPFGMIGAVWGHALLGLPLTLFSMFGLVALSGVVINDSIVLIDFINSRIREGESMENALLSAGQRRFRPIMLTSMTTIAGLIPLMLEKSFQAQLLIPMATSLAFGLMLATFLVLFLVPVFYSVYNWLLKTASQGFELVGLGSDE